MKIAMISEGWEPILGGGQLYAKYLSEHLVCNHGCNVDVFTRSIIDEHGNRVNNDESHLDAKLKVRRVGPIAPFFNMVMRVICLITTTWFLFRKAKKVRYDIIHAHALLAGIPALVVGRLLNIPVVYTVHGSMHLDTEKKNLFYYAEKFLITRLRYDCEISVSSKILNYSNRNNNIVIIPPGIDPYRFHPEQISPKYPGINFLFVGRLDRQKGLEYLIQAISLIDKTLLNRYDVHMNIIGDGNLRSKLEGFVEQHNIAQYVSFHGVKTGVELIEEYKKNHIFVLPSLAEGQPIVIPEAFICGLPVIGTDVGDVKKLVDDESGVLCPPRDAQSLSAALVKLMIMTQEERMQLAKTGYDRVLAEYTRQAVTQRIFDEYGKLRKKS